MRGLSNVSKAAQTYTKLGHVAPWLDADTYTNQWTVDESSIYAYVCNQAHAAPWLDAGNLEAVNEPAYAGGIMLKTQRVQGGKTDLHMWPAAPCGQACECANMWVYEHLVHNVCVCVCMCAHVLRVAACVRRICFCSIIFLVFLALQRMTACVHRHANTHARKHVLQVRACEGFGDPCIS